MTRHSRTPQEIGAELLRAVSSACASRQIGLATADVVALAAEVLGEKLDPESPFRDLGGTSLAGAAILARIWERQGLRLPLSMLGPETTLRELAAHVAAASERRPRAAVAQPTAPDGIAVAGDTADPTRLAAGVARTTALVADDALPARLVDSVLDRLNVGRPAPTSEGLDRLYLAWCRAVPFDNVLRVLQLRAADDGDPPGLPVRRFFADWLALGTGGLCVPAAVAWRALLRALGFDAYLVVAALDELAPNHLTVAVRFERGPERIVDTVNLSERPVPLVAGAHLDGLYAVTVVRNGDTWMLAYRRARLCRLLHRDPDAPLVALLYEATQRTPLFELFNSAPYACCNRPTGVVTLAGNCVSRTSRDGIRREEHADMPAVLTCEFGFSAHVVARLATC